MNSIMRVAKIASTDQAFRRVVETISVVDDDIRSIKAWLPKFVEESEQDLEAALTKLKNDTSLDASFKYANKMRKSLVVALQAFKDRPSKEQAQAVFTVVDNYHNGEFDPESALAGREIREMDWHTNPQLHPVVRRFSVVMTDIRSTVDLFMTKFHDKLGDLLGEAGNVVVDNIDREKWVPYMATLTNVHEDSKTKDVIVTLAAFRSALESVRDGFAKV